MNAFMAFSGYQFKDIPSCGRGFQPRYTSFLVVGVSNPDNRVDKALPQEDLKGYTFLWEGFESPIL